MQPTKARMVQLYRIVQRKSSGNQDDPQGVNSTDATPSETGSSESTSQSSETTSPSTASSSSSSSSSTSDQSSTSPPSPTPSQTTASTSPPPPTSSHPPNPVSTASQSQGVPPKQSTTPSEPSSLQPATDSLSSSTSQATSVLSPASSGSSSASGSTLVVTPALSQPVSSASPYTPLVPSMPSVQVTAPISSPSSDQQPGQELNGGSKSTPSKVVPILLPCILIPVVLLAVVLCLVRRRRQQHQALVDDFTNGSTIFGGGTPLMLDRQQSRASSSRYDHSLLEHNIVSYSPPVTMQVPGTPHVLPPTPRSTRSMAAQQQQYRQSDDLEIRCAGRTESSGSFSALYDAYSSELAYDQASFISAPAQPAAPASVPGPPPKNSFFDRPQFLRTSDVPAQVPTRGLAAPFGPPRQVTRQANPVTGAPQLSLPLLPSLEFNRSLAVQTPSPISAVWKSEDPFAQQTPPPPLPPPTRVSPERRAARTRSIEQRLMRALENGVVPSA